MILYPVMSLRCEFQIVELGNKVTAVCVDEGKNGYHGVIKLNNEEARFMFEKLQAGITLPKLIEACMEEYKSSEEDVGPKVTDFLDKLKEQDLLTADPAREIQADTPDGKATAPKTE